MHYPVLCNLIHCYMLLLGSVSKRSINDVIYLLNGFTCHSKVTLSQMSDHFCLVLKRLECLAVKVSWALV